MAYEQELAAKLFGSRNNEEIPTILCRRNMPMKLTYNLHDYTWEGLKKVTRNGKTAFEIDRNFVLTIGVDGTCKIPKTPNNEKRLSWMSKPIKTKATRKKFDFTEGKEVEYEVEIVEPPMYERIEDSLFETELLNRLAEQLRQRQEFPKEAPVYEYAAEAPTVEPEDTHVKPLPIERKVDEIPDNVEAMEQPPEEMGEEVQRPRRGRKPKE